MTQTVDGLVVRAQSGFFTVESDQGLVTCKIPKRMKFRQRKLQETQEEITSDLVAVGDRVALTVNRDGSGTIASVYPRKSVLNRSRPVAGTRQLESDREQVLVANPDQVIFVFAARDPEPNLRKLDRLLVIAEMNELPAIICVNKIDLADEAEMQALFAPYTALGYDMLLVSARRGDGIPTLRARLQDKLSVFAGSSGVGKSSLLNALQPGLGLEVKTVSEATTKGRHTTRYTALYKLAFGGYLADTPGIRGVALFDVEPAELDAYFREIAPLVAACQFSDCTHRDEPGCAVRAAVLNGEITPGRYDSYLRLREEHEQLERRAY